MKKKIGKKDVRDIRKMVKDLERKIRREKEKCEEKTKEQDRTKRELGLPASAAT